MVVMVVGMGVGGWRYWRHADAGDLVANRVWIDHLPRNDRDVVQVVVLVSDQAMGLFGATSQWKQSTELFRYEQNGSEVRVHYPQTGEHEKLQARATRCKEGGMDYCLEVKGASRGVKRYYSQEGWEIDGLDGARARVAALPAGH